MPIHRTHLVALLACTTNAALTARAIADTGIYLGTDLSIEAGEILTISETTLTVEDREGRVQRIPLRNLSELGLVLPPPIPAPIEGRYFVELTDGQRVVIDLAESPDPESITGNAPGLGIVTIPLDRIRLLSSVPTRAPQEPSDADRVTLLNGDVLTGFVAELGKEILIESDTGVITTVKLARAGSVQLANPTEPISRESIYVHDSLGFTIIAHEFDVEPDLTLTIQADAAPLGIASNGEERVTYRPDNARFTSFEIDRPTERTIGLASREIESTRPTGGRRWTPEPTTLASKATPHFEDVFLPAPAEVRFRLPEAADAFATGITHRGGHWTDCRASVFAELRDGSRILLAERSVIASNRFDAPIEPVSVDLPDGAVALILAVEPGRFGAIQDAVIFTKPRIRVSD